ncbi:hypothetical protein ANN_03890 [Periplaneta americana]|uniref:Actin-related protein 10 n=1 Tax=Periplaneta americana TaxID=6978 RepID=A0ABQ8U467_PERAM|nr:hypothetical protein ANN_03890 [Periplaneta americana]
MLKANCLCRKQKWTQLEASCKFEFPNWQALRLDYKAACRRLHAILDADTMFPRCYHCLEFSCRAYCVEDRGSKVVVDIGNKFTWIVTPSFGVRRHFTMYGIPKTSPHDRLMFEYIFYPMDVFVFSHNWYSEQQPEVVRNDFHTFRLIYINSCFLTNLHSNKLIETEYRSNLQEDNSTADTSSAKPAARQMPKCERRSNGPFCVFCNPVKLYREKKRVALGGTIGPSRYTELLNGFCKDTVDILGIPNMEVVSPAAALLRTERFPVVRDFVGHLFHQMGLVPVLQKPNAVLVFCEPLAMSDDLRVSLLHYLFLKIKIARVCMVAKPLATCAMVGMETCVVVDSGALSTSVAVVLNGQVVPDRWRDIPVGGWHVAENLKQAMQWQPEEYTEIPVSYLDTLAVKEKCRLSYNFANEERRKGPARREHINLRVDSYADYKQFWRVSLGAELYLAPELMYTSLGLPQVIRDVTDGLPVHVLKECLGHILLTGGNTDLVGFKTRVARDLRDLLPEFSTVLDVKTCPGSSSWSVAMGSTYLTLPRSNKPTRTPGTPFWLSREEYILYGCDLLSDA